MEKKKIVTLIALTLCLNMYSQSDGIISSSASYTNLISYNTGEVFVIFTIQNEVIVSKETTTDLDDNLLDDIIAYPNPVTAVLNITTTSGKSLDKIFLFSSEGKMILSQTVFGNQVDLSGLPQGTYLLKTDISSPKTFKIIKQ